jgi:hypothetical protein
MTLTRSAVSNIGAALGTDHPAHLLAKHYRNQSAELVEADWRIAQAQKDNYSKATELQALNEWAEAAAKLRYAKQVQQVAQQVAKKAEAALHNFDKALDQIAHANATKAHAQVITQQECNSENLARLLAVFRAGNYRAEFATVKPVGVLSLSAAANAPSAYLPNSLPAFNRHSLDAERGAN